MKISNFSNGRSESFSRLVAFLNTQPEDEVFTSAEIEARVDVHLDSKAIRNRVQDYRETVMLDGRKTRVWGNKKAIAALREQLSENPRC